MRFLVKISLPTERSNELFKKGTFAKTVQEYIQDVAPEAAYFVEMDGKRTGIFIVNMNSASEMPKIAEPAFLAFGAQVELHPAMLPSDLQLAGPDIEAAVKKFA